MRDSQSRDELAIFGRFLSARGLQVDPARYSKRPEPEPDILFDDDSGLVAFEVVEIIDEDWARILRSTQALNSALRDAFNALPPATRSALGSAYRDADIGFHFKPGMSRNRRLNKLPLIFAELAKLPADTAGPALDEHPACGDVLFNSYIHRAPSIQGPHFYSSDVTSVGDATVDAIEDKVSKAVNYQSNAPIELLAYTDANAAEMPDDVWRANVAAYLATKPVIRFRRIWIFNTSTDTAHLVFTA